MSEYLVKKMSKLKSINEILERCSVGAGGTVRVNGKYVDGFEVDEAKAKLLEALESCKPEEEAIEKIDGTKVVNEWQRGYNQALDNYHSNIRKLFQ